MANFKTPPPTSLLCKHHKCMLPMLRQMKDGPSFIKFLKSVYSSYTIHIHKTNVLNRSITGVICCLSLFCGYITSTECP